MGLTVCGVPWFLDHQVTLHMVGMHYGFITSAFPVLGIGFHLIKVMVTLRYTAHGLL